MQLEKLQLLPLEHGRLEQIRTQRRPILVEAETLDRQPEAQADLLGIWAGAALTHAELRSVVASAMHGLHEMDDALGAIGELSREPLAEQRLDLEWQSEEHVSRRYGAGISDGFEYGLDL